MPESLLNASRRGGGQGADVSVPGFKLAARAITALKRLKAAGFMIIGVGWGELFHGFATRGSCQEFLAASSLDDLIISKSPANGESCCAALIGAAAKWFVDLDRSFIIGKDESITAAGLTGCTPLRIERRNRTQGNGRGRAYPDLPSAVERILAVETAGRPPGA